jgi:hypothetical protein
MRDRKKLSVDEALSVLNIRKDGDESFVHSFRGGGMIVIGRDWSLEDVKICIEGFNIEVAGEVARGMGHGLVSIDDHGAVFFETDKEKLNKLDSQEDGD